VQPRFRLLWAVVATALALCGYGGYKWSQIDVPDEQELQASIELNLQLDKARMRSNHPEGELDLPPEWEDKHRKAIREELLAQVEHEKDVAQSWMIGGIALLIFGLGRLYAAPLFNRHRAPDEGSR